MKVCSCCKEKREESFFQKRAASKDGLTSACKLCLKERDRIRDQSEARKKVKEAYVKGVGKHNADSAKKKWLRLNNKKRRAHIIVGNAVRDGKLSKRSCEICESVKSHAHHDDYDKPLDVSWLCSKHHRQWHDKNGEGKNGKQR